MDDVELPWTYRGATVELPWSQMGAHRPKLYAKNEKTPPAAPPLTPPRATLMNTGRITTGLRQSRPEYVGFREGGGEKDEWTQYGRRTKDDRGLRWP